MQDFLKPIGQLASSLRKGRKPVSLSPNDSMEEYVLALRQARVHRVFICEASRPIGVCSLTDLIRQLEFD
jgi:signal-transduction protein with cAMP-binding, CBS, and nucleotidyltransferase domain